MTLCTLASVKDLGSYVAALSLTLGFLKRVELMVVMCYRGSKLRVKSGAVVRELQGRRKQEPCAEGASRG